MVELFHFIWQKMASNAGEVAEKALPNETSVAYTRRHTCRMRQLHAGAPVNNSAHLELLCEVSRTFPCRRLFSRTIIAAFQSIIRLLLTHGQTYRFMYV